MIKLGYEFCDGTPLLTEYEKGTGSYIEYRVAATESGCIKIGRTTVKLTDGVGRVDFSEISHGEHCPILTDFTKAFKLDRISVFGGDGELSRESVSEIPQNKKLVNLEKRLAKAEAKISELSEAVCRKIF